MLVNVCKCPSAAVWARRPPPANHYGTGTERSGTESVCVTAFLISAVQTGVALVTGTINQYCVTGGLAAGKAWKHRYTNVSDIRTRESFTRRADWPRIHRTLLLTWQYFKSTCWSGLRFLGFLRRFRMRKSAGWRTRTDRCRNMKSTCWILMLDDLITRANLLPFLWTLAHKGFMNSFPGLKSSNSDLMKGSESYKRIVKTGFLLFLCIRAVIYTFYNLMEQCMIFYLFSEVTIVLQALCEGARKTFFFAAQVWGSVDRILLNSRNYILIKISEL